MNPVAKIARGMCLDHIRRKGIDPLDDEDSDEAEEALKDTKTKLHRLVDDLSYEDVCRAGAGEAACGGGLHRQGVQGEEGEKREEGREGKEEGPKLSVQGDPSRAGHSTSTSTNSNSNSNRNSNNNNSGSRSSATTSTTAAATVDLPQHNEG